MKPVFLRKTPMTILYRIVLALVWLFFKIFYRHRVYGLEHFYTGSAIIAANHGSFYDPPLVAVSWPDAVHFLARETLFRGFIFKRLITALNAHPVSGDAADVSVLRMILQELKGGKKVILFPEGTRSLDGVVQEFKPGLALLAQRSGSAVIPTFVDGYHVWPRSKTWPKFWGKTKVVFGKPVFWSEFEHLEKRAAQHLFTQKIRNEIIALQHEYEGNATKKSRTSTKLP